MKTIDNNRVIYSFKPKMEFIEKVKLGEIFKVKTNDCFLGQIKSESLGFEDIDNSKINPATGPIFIEGAEIGDLLKVEILKIEIDKEGVALLIPGEGILGDKVKKSETRILKIEDGYVKFNELSIPIRPMIGVIGLAPAEEEGEWATDVPWKHGGNMDTTDITEGTNLYLPVRQKGGFLALGDCHAIMGDGEVSITGGEIGAEVTLRVDIIKEKIITWPLLETNKYTMVIASGDTLEDATINATDQVVKHLQTSLDLTWEDAYILTGLAVDFKISQIVNPKLTVRGTIPKYLLKTRVLIDSI